ncbi:beta subunit, partial [human gut metagenome]
MWKQGWARDTLVRSSSSSGGVAQAIERAFVRTGGIVCSCAFEKGTFGFMFAESEKEVEKFKGSKYVKSNPSGIYKKIKEYLIAGRKVLFVGLPCQVEAVKCYVGEKHDNSLYTVDLICHGSPSPKVLDMFLAQYDIDTPKLSDIQFRNKNNFAVREGTSYIVQKG